MTIRRIDPKELKKIGRPGVTGAEEAPPAGISPILRSSWKFASDTAKRFSQELAADDPKRKSNFVTEALKNLAKRFS